MSFKVSDHALKFYLQKLAEHEKTIFNIVEMECLAADDLRKIMIDLSMYYKDEMSEEIRQMTKIID